MLLHYDFEETEQFPHCRLLTLSFCPESSDWVLFILGRWRTIVLMSDSDPLTQEVHDSLSSLEETNGCGCP